jgi:diguanylate cyclase (GGDEF)-like protein
MSNNHTHIVQREYLFASIDEIIEQSKSQSSEFALLLLKIDRFRYLNLTHGFDIGDQLIEEILLRLTNIARPEDKVWRYAGSEFLLLIRNLQGEGHADLAAIRILSEFEDSFQIADEQIKVDASIGGSIFPFHGRDSSSLCVNLENALLESRKSPENYFIFANKSVYEDGTLWDIHSDLKIALEKDQLEIHFQPQVELRSGRVIGAEALLRWKHPTRGYICPDSFIEFAEEDGLIHEITLWIIHNVLWLIREWPSSPDKLRVSVNLSTRSFEREGLIESINDTIAIFDTGQDQLTLEITESAIVKDMDSAIEFLNALVSMGINISIDDFGTGYSSFSYFKHIPAGELKIDRSFVKNMLTDKVDLHIVKSIISMAHGFNLKVVAEGIEDRETYQLLTSLGCDFGQGFYVSEAITQTQFIEWLNQYHEAISQIDTANLSGPISENK